MWDLGQINHAYTVKSTAAVSYTSKGTVGNKKVFHTRMLLTLHWLLCRSYWQPVTNVSGEQKKKKKTRSKVLEAKSLACL